MKNDVKITYYLIISNYLLFLIHYIIGLNGLALNHSSPEIYQYVTSIFMHGNFTHISGNMFFLYFFGKLIEEKIGGYSFLTLFILTGLFTNIIEHIFIVDSNILSLGASGSVFGLFSVSLLLNKRKDWKEWVEVLVLGPFVVSYMLAEYSSLGANDSVSHSAHLIGGILGPIIFKLLKRK